MKKTVFSELSFQLVDGRSTITGRVQTNNRMGVKQPMLELNADMTAHPVVKHSSMLMRLYHDV